jgi:cbb3-type cytochrome oxidase maturation protein
MDILYLLIPVSAALVLGVLVVFAWALRSGQFDDLEREGERILQDATRLDADQGAGAAASDNADTPQPTHATDGHLQRDDAHRL